MSQLPLIRIIGKVFIATLLATLLPDAWAQAASGASPMASSSKGEKSSRSIEDIRQTFDFHKFDLFYIYTEALRKYPGLRGKVVFKLRIAPSGDVTSCEVISSTLPKNSMEAELVSRIRSYKFGSAQVEPTVITWPIDFFPE